MVGRLFEQTIETISTLPPDEKRASFDRMTDNFHNFLKFLKPQLSTDIWVPLNKLRDSHYKKRYDDYGRKADERSIDDDENPVLLANPKIEFASSRHDF
eukprot:CAMPEP_0185749802 /NCGR_PEP_ID=MMETSP1174-20130828/8522_1 /TAXON_ID=35687 /ORGANISM="Dictyocha speculum, Strain CCMP1381" /LENGTH=98 /DNA_ID=CAMNT_0028426083 /DNA_START=139 /DNA_END=432 /DNA_ORIENTATION=-